jgi:guanylate kinase
VTPRVVVLAGPSGGGKTTIARELVRRWPGAFCYSVSATTRRPRPGERDGEAYHFLTREEFARRVEAGAFLEWAEYAGERYGTLRAEVERGLAGGRHVLLDIEVQGARQVRAAYPPPASVGIFVLPPSPQVLLERLRARGTESQLALRERLLIAVREVEAAERGLQNGRVFDGILVNDRLDAAVSEVRSIVDRPDPSIRRASDTISWLAAFGRELALAADRLTPSAQRST